MLDKGDIIQLALIKLGETGLFNDDRDQVYETAVLLLNNLIKNIASDRDFLFNATMVALTRTDKVNALGYYQYNVPVDFMSEVRVINPNRKDLDVSGTSKYMQPVSYFERPRLKSYKLADFYYANCEELVLIYCRTINFLKFPDYMEDYLVYALAVSIGQAFTTYADKLNEMFTLMEQARAQVQIIEGSTIAELEGGVYNAESTI